MLCVKSTSFTTLNSSSSYSPIYNIHLCSCAINTASPDGDIDSLTKHSVSGIGLQETMKAYICVLWIFCGLSLAVPLSEDLEVKEEDMRIVNGHESIPGNMLL